MADFERRQSEIGLEFICWSSAERNNFIEGSSESMKDTLILPVHWTTAPRVFELQFLVVLCKFG